VDRLDEIRKELDKCDDKIIRALEMRMSVVEQIISYKKEKGLPILQPKKELEQKNSLLEKVSDNPYKDEILDIYTYIIKNSRKIQAKALFTYNIMLIGFMGCGKTVVSECLSSLLEMESIEMDALIVEKEKKSIPEIFSEYGEAYFRNLESNTLLELQKRSRIIVSCGGGVVLRDENVELMKKRGRVVLLTASPETVLERLKDTTDRPLLNNNMNVEYIAELMAKRDAKYKNAADIIVNTDSKSILKVAEDLVSKLINLDKQSS